MKQIFSSASKLAFLMLVFTTCVGFMCFRLEASDFVYLAGLAFVYYFTRPKNNIQKGGSDVPQV